MSDYAGTENPQTQSGVGGANQDWSQYYLPEQMVGLPDVPQDEHLDAQYLAAETRNRHDILNQYGQYLAQLGYVDPVTGTFIPGSLIQDAQHAEAGYELQRQNAIDRNTQEMQQQGTLFSGIRGRQQALAEQPWLQQIADVELGLPKDMADAYRHAAGLISDYNTQNISDLADAASRYAASHPTTEQTNIAGGNDSNQRPVDQGPKPPNTTDNTTTITSGDPLTDPAAWPGYPTGGRATVPHVTYMAQGGEVDHATNAVIGEKGPEAVVPLTGLMPHEVDAVHGLIAAARARMGNGLRRHDQPGIHWFGPGGSGVAYPPENPPTMYPPIMRPPVGPVHFPPVRDGGPISGTMQPLGGTDEGLPPFDVGGLGYPHPLESLHPRALAHLAELALAARHRAYTEPVHLPTHAVPPPGLSSAVGRAF